MRYVLIALAFVASISAASAQTLPDTLFFDSKAVEVPSRDYLDDMIEKCRIVSPKDRASCKADMTVQRDSWKRLVELVKMGNLAALVGQDFDAKQAKEQARSLYSTIQERDYVIKREWAEVLIKVGQ